MYVYDVGSNIVNLQDKDIYIRTGYEYAYRVVARGALTAGDNEDVASCFTLCDGTHKECIEYRTILAEILDCRDIGNGLTQTRKDEKNE